MPDITEKLDLGSRLVIVITLVLFIAALFVKGFGQGLLLEAGVFLVSVKLIIMAAKHSVSDRELRRRLDRLEATLGEIRDRLRPDGRSGQGDASGSR